MPLPKPKRNEKQADFVSRCVQDLSDKGEFSTNKQRVAVCYSEFNKSKKKSKASILDEAIRAGVIKKIKD